MAGLTSSRRVLERAMPQLARVASTDARVNGQHFKNGHRDHPWMQWQRLEKFFETGQVCVIDGANGTEIQRRGGKPSETFSSGTSPLMRPDLCQEVHQAYLEAGADVIITNSYSANGNVMSPSGNGGRVHECILGAAAIARRATLSHISAHAAMLAHAASAANAAAAQAVAAAATAAARSTTSLNSNEGAEMSANSALRASMLAAEAAQESQRAIAEVSCCAAAAHVAAKAHSAASEGEELESIEGADPPIEPPPPVPTQGWDAAGFGPAMVVGSLSTHPPEMPAGGSSSANARWPDPAVEQERYYEAVRSHTISGVDMLWLEMMKDEHHARRAVKAAATSGLPVFLGVSARTDPLTGDAVLWGSGEDSYKLDPKWFNELADILGDSLVGVNVMHTNFSTMAPALRFIREDCNWTGPLGAYPDHGEFKAPDWIFRELNVQEALDHVDLWLRDFNIQLVGGCCGLGPEFVTALSAHIRRHNLHVRNESELSANGAALEGEATKKEEPKQAPISKMAIIAEATQAAQATSHF